MWSISRTKLPKFLPSPHTAPLWVSRSQPEAYVHTGDVVHGGSGAGTAIASSSGTAQAP